MLNARFRSLAAGLLILAAAGAHAQVEMDPKEMILGSQVFYAFGKAVRDEVKITDAQLKKMTDAFEGAVQVDGERIMVMHDGSLDMEKCKKSALAALEESQQKRLFEVWIQELGGLAIADDKVGKELKLTDEQKKSVKKLLEETADKLKETFHEAPSPDGHKAYLAIRKSAGEKGMALLNEEQKKALKTLGGKPFKRPEHKDGG